VVTNENSETSASTTSAAPNGRVTAGDAKRRRRAPRRDLSEAQKREITHLYSETSTPLPEIRQRFGIGDSSLYRLIQQYGGKLRGRTPRATASTPAAAAARAPSSQKLSRRSPAPARRSPAPAPGRRARAAITRRSVPSVAQSSSKISFRVSFVATRTVIASTMRDAIRQSEAFSATEITEVVRLD
jgi:transposase-like protein